MLFNSKKQKEPKECTDEPCRDELRAEIMALNAVIDGMKDDKHYQYLLDKSEELNVAIDTLAPAMQKALDCFEGRKAKTSEQVFFQLGMNAMMLRETIDMMVELKRVLFVPPKEKK